jgi:S-adenosylmethionine:diacylglycerol 3-amino-3-carboxypropyl transferase
MKKSSLLLSFLILFQSCFSYKTVDYNSIPIEKKQKVEVKGVGGTNIKGTLVSKNEQILTVDTNGQLQKIPVSEIYEVKVRKFSLLKSSGVLASSILVVTAVLFAIFLGKLIGL